MNTLEFRRKWKALVDMIDDASETVPVELRTDTLQALRAAIFSGDLLNSEWARVHRMRQRGEPVMAGRRDITRTVRL